MKDIDEIRRENMATLEEAARGPTLAAARLGWSQSQWSNLRSGAPDSKTGKPRGMRKGTARKIEEAFRCSPGWLDTDHSYIRATVESQKRDELVTISTARKSHEDQNVIVIAHYDTGGAMGEGGVILRDQPGLIESWTVTPEWIQKNIKNCSAAVNLCVITGFGDSMRPLYEPGDPLIVDTGVKQVDFDGIYFFRVGNEGFIKRLQRIPGEGLVAISENKAYRDWTIKPDMDLEIFGRVVKAWRSEDY